MDNHATLLLQVVATPHVVVSLEEMHLNPSVGQLTHFSQETCESSWHHFVVFKPEVEHVAKHIHSLSLVLDGIEEIHQSAFSRPCVLKSS